MVVWNRIFWNDQLNIVTFMHLKFYMHYVIPLLYVHILRFYFLSFLFTFGEAH